MDQVRSPDVAEDHDVGGERRGRLTAVTEPLRTPLTHLRWQACG